MLRRNHCARAAAGLAIGLIAAAGATTAHAAVLAGWESQGTANNNDFKATTIDARLTNTVGLTRGSGLAATATASNTWGGDGWGDGTAAYTNLADAVAANEYYTLTLAPNAGDAVSYESIEMNVRRLQSSPHTTQWQYQIGGGAFVTIGSPQTDLRDNQSDASGVKLANVDLSGIAALQNVTDPVTFRLVAWGTEALAGSATFGIGRLAGNDLIFNGAVPEPASLGALAVATAASLLRRRRA